MYDLSPATFAFWSTLLKVFGPYVDVIFPLAGTQRQVLTKIWDVRGEEIQFDIGVGESASPDFRQSGKGGSIAVNASNNIEGYQESVMICQTENIDFLWLCLSPPESFGHGP